MKLAYPVSEIRHAEAEAILKVGEDALMQRAAQGLAIEILRLLIQRRGKAVGAKVLVLAGPGNNGGDALFAGARLANRGVQVSMVQTASQVHQAGWAALLRAGGQVLSLAEVRASSLGFDLVIDGILGIGGRPGLPNHLAELALLPADQVVAVDLPTGLSAEPPFTADAHFTAKLTVTFGGLKPVHLLQPGRDACGAIVVIDIGLPVMEPVIRQTELADLRQEWPFPAVTADKYSRGVVGIDAGSAQYPGAGLLATAGAVYAGAGMVRFGGDRSVSKRILQRFPNVVLEPAAGHLSRVDSWVLGPGWGDRQDGTKILETVLKQEIPVVIDADGLRYLPRRLHPNVVLTPHAGELARLLGIARHEVEADPIKQVQTAAERFGATVLLKGANQLVATPGVPWVNMAMPGAAWAAQAGSGDVLAGVIGMLLAAGINVRCAAILGASLQALAATKYPGPVPPQELAQRFPALIEAGSAGVSG